MIKIILYTLEIAIFSTLLAAFVGIPVSFFTSHRRFWGRKLILSASIVPLCVPPLIVALGYVSFFGMNGTANSILRGLGFTTGDNKTFLYSTAGIIIAQAFYNFPLITKIMNDAWTRLPKEQENAARLLGTGEKRLFFTITLPQLSGAIVAACIPVFLFCFFSFMIVLLFSPLGKSTIEVEIYHSIRTTLNVGDGLMLAVSETLIALCIVFFYGMITRKSQSSNEGIDFTKGAGNGAPRIGQGSFSTNPRKALEWGAFIIILLLVIVFFVCPGLSILVSAFTQRKGNNDIVTIFQFKKLFGEKQFLTSLWNTCWVGFLTGLCCTLIAFVYSVIIKINKKQGNVVLQTIPIIPMAISSVVIAWCFSLAFHRGHPLLLILMQTMLYWPMAYRQLQNGMNKITFETDSAALLFSRNKMDSIVRVYLPSCKKVIVSSFVYCFAMSAGDATLPLVLSIPRFNSLALYTYKLASSYRFNQACASGVILTILCGLIVFLCESAYKTQ